ncbi:MAG: hypothetical protein U9Q92_00610 [archaeon]|nr:hypothetical protein [archaeon]
MKKLIYGIFALAIIAAIATTASSAPGPNLEVCPENPDVRQFEKSIPGTGGEEYMYWDNDDNYLGKEKIVGGECVFDTYEGICTSPYPLCTIV